MLTSMAMISFDELRLRARINLTKAQLAADVTLIQGRRATDQVVMSQMTGNTWTNLNCDTTTQLHLQPVCVADSDQSWKNLNGDVVAPRDSWGNPFTFDENEQNIVAPGTCGYDCVMSAGPDGILDGWVNVNSDDIYIIVPHFYCPNGPVPMTIGVQY